MNRTSARHAETSDGRGFTLVELMVVLLVVGLGTAVVAPTLPDAAGGDDGGVEGLADRLRRARRAATSRGETVRVTVRPSGGGNAVVRVGAARAGSAAPIGESDTLDLGSAWSRVPATFRFGPLGRAAGPSISLSDGGTRVILRVDPLLGKVEVRRGS